MPRTAQSDQQITDAAALIKTTAEQTAVALNIQYIQKDIVEIKQTLREVAGKFVTKEDYDSHKKQAEETTATLRQQAEDHEKRLRTIEQNMWKWLGALAGVSVLVGYLMKFI